jgi:hypothetical protein
MPYPVVNLARTFIELNWLPVIIGLIVIAPQKSIGQPYSHNGLQIIDSVTLKMAGSVSVDRQQQVYVCNSYGEITRYDSSGKQQQLYSPSKPAEVTLLEAWNSLRIFTFSRVLQEITLLDRFLTPNPPIRIAPELVGYARLVAPAQDEQFWLIDEADFSLKKVNLLQNSVVLNTQLNLILPNNNLDFTFMREYQNQVFIADKKNGIIVMDNMGNYKKTIAAPGTEWFSFSGESIMYLNNGKVALQKLYVSDKKELILPERIKPVYALKAASKYWIFTENTVYLCTEK